MRVKYGSNPNYAGLVMIDGLPNREAALAWEKAQVRAYRAANNGARPPKQYKPLLFRSFILFQYLSLIPKR